MDKKYVKNDIKPNDQVIFELFLIALNHNDKSITQIIKCDNLFSNYQLWTVRYKVWLGLITR